MKIELLRELCKFRGHLLIWALSWGSLAVAKPSESIINHAKLQHVRNNNFPLSSKTSIKSISVKDSHMCQRNLLGPLGKDVGAITPLGPNDLLWSHEVPWWESQKVQISLRWPNKSTHSCNISFLQHASRRCFNRSAHLARIGYGRARL